MAENNKNEGFNFPPVGGKNNKGSKFSGYWMYIIIAAIIIGFNFLSMPTSPERTTWQEVKTQMLEKGDVKEFVVITNTGRVNVYLQPDKIEN